MAVIEVTGLAKRYGAQVALAGVSFSVEQGEIFGILDPNGAGKTTAVECLAGVYFPTEDMSHSLQVVGECTPLGAALHAVRQAWTGQPPHPLYLGIMAAWAVRAGVAATMAFRWE